MTARKQVACGIREMMGILADCFAAKRSRVFLHNLLPQSPSREARGWWHWDMKTHFSSVNHKKMSERMVSPGHLVSLRPFTNNEEGM